MAKITVMPDIDHIRLRPGMYIGSTYSPDHLLQEILDNSLDELVNGYADTVAIEFPDLNHVIVTDNGRGIPIHNVELEGGKVENSVIVACTILKSGAKFDNSAYSMSIGLHGIGLVAVNALSQYMRVSVKDPTNPKQIHDFEFEDSHLKSHNIVQFEAPWSTRVEFIVNNKYFTIGSFDQSRFRDRLRLVRAKFPKAHFMINNEQLPSINMENFVRELLDLPEGHIMYRVPLENSQIHLQAFITYDLDGPATPEIKGDVNLRMCTGTYMSNFTTYFANSVVEEFNDEITKNEALSHFRAYISIFIQNPEFDSQSKGNMTKNISHLLTPLKEHFKKLVKSQLIKQAVQIIIDRKSLKKAAKKVTRRKRTSAENPIKDCLKIPGETLYIMEGESADGTLNPIRDKYTEAILPITGKILNVANASIDKATDSKKFKYLLEALGVDLSKKNQTDFRYDKVKILCDADPDGMHIVVLLIIGIWYYAPALIKRGKVSVVLPPLYGVTKGKQFIPIYDTAEIAKYSGLHVHRYKGIGEMNASQLKVILKDNPVEYIVQPPSSKNEEEAIIRCITDTDLKRRLCQEKSKFNLNRLFPNSDSQIEENENV